MQTFEPNNYEIIRFKNGLEFIKFLRNRAYVFSAIDLKNLSFLLKCDYTKLKYKLSSFENTIFFYDTTEGIKFYKDCDIYPILKNLYNSKAIYKITKDKIEELRRKMIIDGYELKDLVREG